MVVQDKDTSTGASRKLSQSGSGAVEGQQEGLDVMLLRHMMQAMHLGGKAGTGITVTYQYL